MVTTHKEFYKSSTDLLYAMKHVLQHKSQSIYEHGVSVNNHYNHIIDIFHGNKKDVFNLPIELYEWYDKNYNEIFDNETMHMYHIYHDCGKPLCISFDAMGRRHFYNHAELSAEQYKIINPHNEIVYKLIKNDMFYHNGTGEVEEEPAVIKNSLFITAWAEILANAEMFGGVDSTSFKIKKKRLMKILKRGI